MLAGQQERLRTLEANFDPGTRVQLEARGVRPGLRCLEVGAGGGSVALWLAERVAPDGRVLATDLDASALAGMDHPNLDVRVHDVLADELPEGAFDLVHLRLLLAWLPDPRTALTRLVRALRPGGVLLAEEADFVSCVPDPAMDAEACGRFERAVRAHDAVLARRSGFDAHYGRRVAGDLAAAGLTDVMAEGRTAMWRGGDAGGRIWQLTMAQLRDDVVREGLMDAADIDASIALFEDPAFSSVAPVMMAARGRRPSGHGVAAR